MHPRHFRAIYGTIDTGQMFTHTLNSNHAVLCTLEKCGKFSKDRTFLDIDTIDNSLYNSFQALRNDLNLTIKDLLKARKKEEAGRH
jgi:hypothetical protein